MSDCGVCIGGGDYDGTLEFCRVTNPVARKKYRCEDCGRAINPGEKYSNEFGKFDGSIFNARRCLICVEVHAVFNCDGGALDQDLWADMRAYVFPELTTANKCFQKLSPPAKQFVLERWAKWKGI